MFILDDPEAADLGLPDTYGVDDLPVIVQDRSFDGDNQFDFSDRFLSNVGLVGDELLVNGTHGPHVVVEHERVRLRLLNASNARSYDFGFVDGRSFQLVGTDGGLLEAPVDLDRVPLSPGERAEVVVTFRAGEHVVLRSFARGSGAGFFSDRFSGNGDDFDVLQFRVAEELEPSSAVPARLVGVERLDPDDAETTRSFRLSGTRINGQNMDMGRIDESVTAGTTEIWEVSNSAGMPHNFHVHGVQFQVLDIDGERPLPDSVGGRTPSRSATARRFA